jgi:hypothetical protein
MRFQREDCRRIGRGAFVGFIAALAVAVPVTLAAAAEGKSKATSTPTEKSGTVAADKTSTAPSTSAQADTDSSMTLKGGASGKDFRSMTVEGEDRVHVDFGRPELNLDLDPEDVPGLTRGTAMDVLDRTVPDLASPLSAMSSQDRSPYVARPWLREFGTGSVAKLRPAVKGVVGWRLLVADSRGETVASFDGKGDPPKEITWDGRSKSGAPVTPGLTYSYVFEAHDRAGNKRNFVGQGFTVSAYRMDSPNGPILMMSGRDLMSGDADRTGYGPSMRSGTAAPAPIFLEVASWLNQSSKVREPVRVAVGARTRDQANSLANRASTALTNRVIGDPARIQVVTEITPDAPEDGVLRVGAIATK